MALTEMDLPPDDIIASFTPYRPAGYTSALAVTNLEAKVKDHAFRSDLEPLVGSWPDGYDIDSAANLIRTTLLRRL